MSDTVTLSTGRVIKRPHCSVCGASGHRKAPGSNRCSRASVQRGKRHASGVVNGVADGDVTALQSLLEEVAKRQMGSVLTQLFTEIRLVFVKFGVDTGN